MTEQEQKRSLRPGQRVEMDGPLREGEARYEGEYLGWVELDDYTGTTAIVRWDKDDYDRDGLGVIALRHIRPVTPRKGEQS